MSSHNLPLLPRPPPSLAAIIWLAVGTYILSVITEARASAVLRSLRRTSGLRHPSIIHLALNVPLTSVAVRPQVMPYPACVVSTPSHLPLRLAVPAELASSHAVVSLCAEEDLPIQWYLVPVGISDGLMTRSPSEVFLPMFGSDFAHRMIFHSYPIIYSAPD